MAEKYTNVIFLAAYTFLMAKVISANDFGVISNADAIIAIISIFSFQGLEQLIQREIVKTQEDECYILGAAMLFKIPGMVFGLLLSVGWAFLFTSDKQLSLCVLILSGLIIARSLNFLSSPLITKNSYIKYTLIGMGTYFLFFVVKIIVLFFLPSLTIIAFVTVSENIFLVVLYYIYGSRTIKLFHSSAKKYLDIYMKEGFYLILSGAMVIIYTKTDQLYIAKFMSYSILADYAIALKFLMLYIIPSTIFTLSFVSKLNKNSINYNKTVRDMLLGSLVIGVVLGIICATTTPYLIGILYGNKYELAKEYIVGLSFVVPLCFILNSTGRFFVNEGMGKFVFYRNLLALIYNIVAGYFLIKYNGAWGGVIAICSSYAVSAFIAICCSNKTRNLMKQVLLTK